MAVRTWRTTDDWVDVAFVGVPLLIGMMMIFVGALVLLDATVILLAFLIYQWLRYWRVGLLLACECAVVDRRRAR